VQSDLTDILKKVQKKGVCVQASTLGSLEALLTFLGESNIPVGSINIGPVHRSDVIKASVNLDKGKRKEFGCILAFDVPVDKDAKAEAAKAGVRIFTADIIYHLFDQFTAYLAELKAKEKAEAALKVVFPCILEIVPGCVFNKKDPIVIGVRVVEGLLKLGTPLCVQKIVTTTDDEGRTRNRKEMLYIGKITSLQVRTLLQISRHRDR
jgi:translation initiation factor 5B